MLSKFRDKNQRHVQIFNVSSEVIKALLAPFQKESNTAFEFINGDFAISEVLTQLPEKTGYFGITVANNKFTLKSCTFSREAIDNLVLDLPKCQDISQDTGMKLLTMATNQLFVNFD